MGSLTRRARRGRHIAVLTLLAVAGGRSLAAQSGTSVLVSGGLSIPTSDFHLYAGLGSIFSAGFERSIGRHAVGLRVDLSYASNSDTDDEGAHERTSFIDGMASVVYHFQGARPRIYLLVGGGFEHQAFSTDDPFAVGESSNHAAFQVGEGVLFPRRTVTPYLEGRFIASAGNDGLERFAVVVGVRFGRSSP